MASLKGYRQGFWKHMRAEAKLHRAANILPAEKIEEHFERASAYRATHFTGFELQWSTMTDVVKQMTCPFPNEGIYKDAGMPKLHCALGRCVHCTGRLLPVDRSERWLWGQDDIDDCNMILWKQYDGRYQCENHGLLPEGTSKCPTCAAIPKEKAPKDPRRKIEYCRKRAPIGNYLTDVLQPFMEKYRYHLFLMVALGKNWCLKTREENYRLEEGSVLMVRDYANKLPVEMNDMAQSHGMSNRRAIGSEGITLKYMKEDTQVMDFYSFLATDSKQNAKTSYIHTCQTIEKQIENGYLKRNSGAKLYEQSDGCSAQYTSGTAIKFAIMIANRYGIVVNRCTTAPQHGKGTCDSQGGWDKAYLRKQFLVSALTDDEYDKGFDNATLDEHGNHVDPSFVAADLLNDSSRNEALQEINGSGIQGTTTSAKSSTFRLTGTTRRCQSRHIRSWFSQVSQSKEFGFQARPRRENPGTGLCLSTDNPSTTICGPTQTSKILTSVPCDGFHAIASSAMRHSSCLGTPKSQPTTGSPNLGLQMFLTVSSLP